MSEEVGEFRLFNAEEVNTQVREQSMKPQRDNRLKRAVDRIYPEIVALRHRLHQIPELAGTEYQTSALIRDSLGPSRVTLLKPFLKTDVVGLLKGRKQGRNVTLRADMDALPLLEKNTCAYVSAHDGCMHACGHDGHTAMLIGAARVLECFADELAGSIRFVFQPGEEVAALGKALVARGALDNPPADLVIAVHGWPGIPEGVIRSKPGVLMAAAGFFKLTIQGQGAHGSRPDQSIDPILTGARIVEAFASLTRESSPFTPATIGICRFQSGLNGNVIPDTAEIEGTIRYLDAGTGPHLVSRMRKTVEGICKSMGATGRFSYREPYIPTVNHPQAVDIGRAVATRLLGSGAWQEAETPSLGGEDFAYYLKAHPGAMFWLGLGTASAGLHNPHFDFNDRVIKSGILFLAGCALDGLQG